jgi:hypothetical protein
VILRTDGGHEALQATGAEAVSFTKIAAYTVPSRKIVGPATPVMVCCVLAPDLTRAKIFDGLVPEPGSLIPI